MFGAMFDKVDRQRQTLIATTKSFDEVLISFATASPNFFLSQQQKFFSWNQFSTWLKCSQHKSEFEIFFLKFVDESWWPTKI